MSRAAKLLGGCIPETVPAPAPKLQPLSAAQPPNSVDLRDLCSPIEHQFNIGSCTSQAVVAALEYHQRRLYGQHTDLSRLFLHFNARRMAGNEGKEMGSSLHQCLAAVLAYGVCPEEMWPYTHDTRNTQPPEKAYDAARALMALEFGRVDRDRTLIPTLAAGLPVPFFTQMPGAYYEAADKTGFAPSVSQDKSPPPAEPESCHAMLVVGYDLNSKVWIVRNSWGTDWGASGYFLIPFDTMAAYTLPDWFWAIGAIEQATMGRMGVAAVGQPAHQRSYMPAQSAAAATPQPEAPAQEAGSAIDRMKQGLRDKVNTDLAAAKKSLRDRLRGPGSGGGY
jgi:hypothetical protein